MASGTPWCHAVGDSYRQTGSVITSHHHPAHSRDGVPRRPRLRSLAAAVALAALVVSACGSADDTVTSDESDAETVETTIAVDAVDAEPAGLQQTGPIDVTGDPLDPFDSSIDDLSVGTAAPVVSGERFDGTEIVLGAPTDNPTLVVFLAHWCPHCNEEVPELISLEEEGRIPDGLDVVGVSTAAVADRDNYPPSEWVEEKGWPWPTMADDEIQSAIAAFGGTSFPFAVVLDADGTVLARRAGQATGDETVAFLEAALAGTEA